MDTDKIMENIDKGIANGKKRAVAKSKLNGGLDFPHPNETQEAFESRQEWERGQVEAKKVVLTRDVTYEEFGQWWYHSRIPESEHDKTMAFKKGAIMYKYTGLPWTPWGYSVECTEEAGSGCNITLPSDAIKEI